MEGQEEEQKRAFSEGTSVSPACISSLSPSREEQCVPAALQWQAAPSSWSSVPELGRVSQARQRACCPLEPVWNEDKSPAEPLASTNTLKAYIWWRSEWFTQERE